MSVPTPCEPVPWPLPRLLGERPVAVTSEHLAGYGSDLEVAVATSPGLRHEINEDAHSDLDGSSALYLVADGVGGGALASQASRELVDRVHEALRVASVDERAVREALLDADLAVARSIARRTDEPGAATVAVCASLRPDFSAWLVAWVGDCRVYRLDATDRGEAELLTRDDTYRHLDESPPPGGSPDDPARMLGNGAVIAPNLVQVALEPSAMLLMCSDGVHAHVDGRDLVEALRREDRTLEQRCASVVGLARQRGGTDDATLLVVRRTEAAARPENAV